MSDRKHQWRRLAFNAVTRMSDRARIYRWLDSSGWHYIAIRYIGGGRFVKVGEAQPTFKAASALLAGTDA